MQPAGSTTAIAVVDMGSIFKNHVGFQAAMEKLRDEVMTHETALKGEQDRIQGLMEQLVGFKSGSEKYKQLEAEVAKAMSDFSVRAQLEKKDFVERETKIYWQIYADIEKAVEEHARANRITAVLSDEKVAAALRQPKTKPAHDGHADRKQLLESMQNPVVYVAPGRHDSSDITPRIIAMLNGKAAR